MMATLANVGADVAKAKPAVLDAYQIVADAAQKNAIGLKKEEARWVFPAGHLIRQQSIDQRSCAIPAFVEAGLVL